MVMEIDVKYCHVLGQGSSDLFNYATLQLGHCYTPKPLMNDIISPRQNSATLLPKFYNNILY